MPTSTLGYMVEGIGLSRVSLDSAVEWALQNLEVAIQETGTQADLQPLGSVTGKLVVIIEDNGSWS